jgi:Polyketide cyclase / dehydrase and lipid transport
MNFGLNLRGWQMPGAARIDRPLDALYHRKMVKGIRRKLCFGCTLALAWVATQAHAAQVLGVQVTRAEGGFLIGMQIAIDAPAPAVFRALQDYSAMMRYNPDLRAVRVQSTGVPGRVRLFTTVHTCVLIFCKTMHQEQIMTAVAGADGGVLEAQLLPHGGAFKAGDGRWTVTACRSAPSTTCLDARIELVPAFWVPPVIGPWVLRRKMAEEASRTSTGLERMALGARS